MDEKPEPALPASPGEIDAYLEESRRLRPIDPSLAEKMAEAAVQAAQRLGYASGVANGLRERGASRGAQGKLDEGFADMNAALVQARSLDDRTLEANCLHAIGNFHYYFANFAGSIEYSLQAIALWRELGDVSGLMRTLCNIGGFHTEQGHFGEGLTYLLEALQCARQQNEPYTLMMILSNIGNIHHHQNDYVAACASFRESVEIGERTGDRYLLPTNLGNLANTLVYLGRPEEALPFARRAVELAQTMSNPFHLRNPLFNLGFTLESLGEHARAEEAYLQALQSSDPPHAYILTQLGSFYAKQGRFTEARRFLDNALALQLKADRPQERMEVYRELSALAEAEGDYREALEQYKRFRETEREKERRAAHNLLIAELAKGEAQRARQQAADERRRAEELARANTEKEDLLRKLARHATEDPLTGLYNRRYLYEFLHKMLAETERYPAPLSVVIADLDNFKQVNDRFLHRTGDIVLQTVARLFRAQLQKNQVAARYGGEEFALVLPGVAATQARQIAEKVRADVENYPWADVHAGLRVTVSMGIADEPAPTPDELLALADLRLYHAKEMGKNRIV